jgi:AcrR family transcriptional regulator
MLLGFNMVTGRESAKRRIPRQARSRQTVECILEAATRVFRREGFRATTNRVATEAGVSIGSFYEYFPNKQALLTALAERHVALAEVEVAAALLETKSIAALLTNLQRAILSSQRYPSEALELLSKRPQGPLQARASSLRQQALAGISAALRRRGHPDPEAQSCAQAALGAIGDLTVQTWLRDPGGYEAVATQLLEMAVRHCMVDPKRRPG